MFMFCCQNLGLTHTDTVFLFLCGLVNAVHERDTMFITWQRHFFRKQRPATGMAFGVLTFFDTVCYCCTAIKYEAFAFPHTFFSRSFFQRSEEHTSELQSRENLVCRLLLEKKKT